MEIREAIVVGAGLMGSGIAQVLAQVGISVTLHDTNPEAINKAQKSIAWSVEKLIEKRWLEDQKERVLARIRFSEDLEKDLSADLAIEAVFEDLALKKDVLAKLDAICLPETYLASNTSTLSITTLAEATCRPERVLGLHFFSPVPMMAAVEVIRGEKTSAETMAMGVGLIRRLGKEPIRVECDMPGFLLNRIHLLSYVEAIRLLEQGVATAKDIDKGMRLAFGRPMGPFETGDMVGLDVSYNALKSIYQASGDERYKPPRYLEEKVQAGHLGRKTGRGWYAYEMEGAVRE